MKDELEGVPWGDDVALPRLPGGPAPGEPVPRDPVHGVDIVGYAEICAAIAEDPGHREGALADRGLDDRTWTVIERTWALRLASAALALDLSLQHEFDQAFARTQDALGGEALSMERFAEICGRMRAGVATHHALAHAGASLADWSRAQRRFVAMAGEDPAVEEKLETLILQAERNATT
jgi:hypothetical protein